MTDPLTHLIHLPGPANEEPSVCEDCQAAEAEELEANGHFLAERSEARHLAFLDTLDAAELEALRVAAMELGHHLDHCIDDYGDAHPELHVSYGLVYAALRYLYWSTEQDMRAEPGAQNDDC